MKLMVNLDVPELAAAEALYTRAFGLGVGRRFGDSGVELLGAGVPLYLLCKASGSLGAADSPRDYRRHWTPVHLDVVVDELEPALALAVAAGMLQEGGIREERWGRIVQLADPFGHGWCLLQLVGRGYDEVAT